MLKPYNKDTKYLFVTRGIPGSGKSSFVKNYLEPISTVIESDTIRKDLMGLVFNEEKKDYGINQANGADVWKEIYRQVRENLKKTSVTLDATNIHKWSLNTAEDIAKEVNAEIVIVDFSNVTLNDCLSRNNWREPSYKRVPEDVIIRMHKEICKANEKLYDVKNLYSYDIIKDWLNAKK